MAEGAIGALAVRIVGDVSDFVQKFDRADKSVEKFSNKLDKRLLQPLAKVGAAAAIAGAGILALTTRVSKMGDQFAKMSEKVGASTEFLSAFAHAASLGGVSTEQLEKGLGRMTRTMSDASNGLATAQRSFGQLGVEVKNTDGSLRAVPDVILEVADRFAGMTDATKKAALAQEIFGRSGLDLIPVLNQGSEAIRKQMEEARRLGIVWSTEAAKAAEEFNDNLERLGKAVDGLNIKLAGPMVEAFNKAAEAMLNAQQRGEGFFRTIIEGFRTMVTGDDAHKWNVEMAEAGETLLKAQNKLDQAMRVQRSPGMREWGERLVKEAKTAVDRAQAEIARLQSIKPILAPDAPEKTGDGKPKGAAPTLFNPEAEKAAAEREQQIRDIIHQVRVKDDERELAQIDLQNEKKEELREHDRQANLDRIATELADEEEKAKRLADIREAIGKADKAQQDRELQARRTFVDNLAGLMNTSSKKAFEFGKKVSIAQAAVKGAQAVMDAWQAGMSTGGPWAPVIAAGYAAAAAVNAANIIQNIRSQEFGGGGGAPVAPSQGSSGISPVGAGGGGQERDRPSMHTTVVLPAADLTSTAAVRQMLLGLTEEIEANGGRLSIQG